MSEGPSLLDELGLEEETLSWYKLALCGGRKPGDEGMPLNWFYDDYEADESLAKAMDEVCLKCPVMRECLMEASDRKDYGLHGAIYLNNGKPDPARNMHKTEEVWTRIRKRLEDASD